MRPPPPPPPPPGLSSPSVDLAAAPPAARARARVHYTDAFASVRVACGGEPGPKYAVRNTSLLTRSCLSHCRHPPGLRAAQVPMLLVLIGHWWCICWQPRTTGVRQRLGAVAGQRGAVEAAREGGRWALQCRPPAPSLAAPPLRSATTTTHTTTTATAWPHSSLSARVITHLTSPTPHTQQAAAALPNSAHAYTNTTLLHSRAYNPHA